MSARMQAAVWIIALIVTPVGFGTVNAQPANLPGPVDRTDEVFPEKRPADLRPLMHNLLIGLHPAAGLVSVDCLIDFDDEDGMLAFRVRDIPNPILRFLGLAGDDCLECRGSEPTRCSTGLTPAGTITSDLIIPIGQAQALPESSTTCPYLKRQKERDQARVNSESPPLCDFEANLQKLSAASKLYQTGLTRLRDGDREGALYYFEQIHEKVPGSRYDSQAIEQMDRMKRDALTPTLPPIDPKIVDALQKVLKETGDPTVPRLIIHVEDLPASEEQEPTVPPEWSGEPQDTEIPRLLIDPVEDKKLAITSDEEEPDDSEELSTEEWSALLREVIDAIRAGLSVGVESNAGPTSASHSEHFGGIEVEITIGSGGEQYVMVSLSLEASGDLRAAQRAHNERILRWIESLNEPCADEDDAAVEEEDGTYGDESHNEAIP
jgi:hypothetical protein